MNADKTKTMVFGDKQISSIICTDGIELENVEKFIYLESNMTYDLDCSKEIAIRIAKAMANLKALDKIRKSKSDHSGNKAQHPENMCVQYNAVRL